ncbi:MAG TPA: helix-turn-helix domain-containing protein [Gaiellaceae bacterium]
MDHRTAIIEALRDSREGLDTKALADVVGLHQNTVRWHLAALVDAGLVAALPERRRGRGRPSTLYRLTGEGVAHDRDEYRALAAMLTAVVASDEHGEARAYEQGVRHGRRLQAEQQGREPLDVLDREGFAVEQRGDTIEMRRCPFYALAADSPQVICTLHQGIIDGALAESGSTCYVDRLDPFVEPSLCVAHLSPGLLRTGR